MNARPRPTREEILDKYRAWTEKLGKPPGMAKFCKVAGVTLPEIKFYWYPPNTVAVEAGEVPASFNERLPDDVIYSDFAKVCLHIGKIPMSEEHAYIAQRALQIPVRNMYTRRKGKAAFLAGFKEWLETAPAHFRLDRLLLKGVGSED